MIYHQPFADGKDIPLWQWNRSKTFTTKSVYDYLTRDCIRNPFCHIWKARIPYKIKIFLWLLENNAILTKDNLIKRHWVGSPTCYFCQANETVQHLFFQCPIAKVIWGTVGLCFGANDIPRNIQQYKTWIAKWLPGGESIYTCGCAAICWAIWKCRNKTCFVGKDIKNPMEMMMHICSFISYWAGLYNESMQEKILEGVQDLLACAHKVLAGQPASSSFQRRLLPPPKMMAMSRATKTDSNIV